MADKKGSDDNVPAKPAPAQQPPVQRDDQPTGLNDQNPLEGQNLITITRNNEAEKTEKKSGA